MYKSPTKPNLTNLHKSPQRLASPTLKSVRQKYQTHYPNRNAYQSDRDTCMQSPKQDKNVSNLKKSLQTNNKQIYICTRDERIPDRPQKTTQQKTKIQSHITQNTQDAKKPQNKNPNSPQIVKTKPPYNQPQQKQQNKITTENCISTMEDNKFMKMGMGDSYLNRSYHSIVFQCRPIGGKEVEIELSEDNYSTINNINASSLQIQMEILQQKNNNTNTKIQKYIYNDNEQNLLNQLQQVCYEDYIIKSMPNIQNIMTKSQKNLINQNQYHNKNQKINITTPTSHSKSNSNSITQAHTYTYTSTPASGSTYERLKTFIKAYNNKYQCQLHKSQHLSDSPTNTNTESDTNTNTRRKIDLICMDCNLLLCDYCVLFGNGQKVQNQGQLLPHQEHKVHKLKKLQEFMYNFKTFLQRYHQATIDLSQINQQYQQNYIKLTNKFIQKQKQKQQPKQIYSYSMLNQDISLLCKLNNAQLADKKITKNQQQQQQQLFTHIQNHKHTKMLQIHKNIRQLISKILQNKYQACKNIERQYKNIKQNISSKIIRNKASFTKFHNNLQGMLYHISQHLQKIDQTISTHPIQLQQQSHKQKIESTIKTLTTKTSSNRTLNQILQLVEKQLSKCRKQNRIGKQYLEYKLQLQNAIKISYNTYIEENVDCYLTVESNVINPLSLPKQNINRQYKTPNKKQHDNLYIYKSDECIYKNVEKLNFQKNVQIQQKYKQNQFIMNFYQTSNNLNRVKSDKNLFKSLQLFSQQKEKQKQKTQVSKYKSPKKQPQKQLHKIKSLQKNLQLPKSNTKKDKKPQIFDESVLSLSIVSKQNDINNLNQKFMLSKQISKSRVLEKQVQKQQQRQITIKNIIEQFCQHIEKNQNQPNPRKFNKQLDLSHLQLNNSQLSQIFTQIHTKLSKISSSLTANKSQLASSSKLISNIAYNGHGKVKLSFVKLSDNRITTQGFISIASYLTSASNINISNNLLDTDILDYIIKNKDKFAPLRILNLKGNFKNLGNGNQNKQTYFDKKIKEKVSMLGKMGILVNI